MGLTILMFIEMAGEIQSISYRLAYQKSTL